MSKTKKLSLPNTEVADLFTYKPKDLIWAKMKGFTPWPAMVVDPPLELLTQPRKTHSKCVFFFGTRNFAWIELNNIKPFEGPWKAELAKVNKPKYFVQAMQDIQAYLDNPTEIDDEIAASVPCNHSREADFDKIRDGQMDDENDTNNTSADNGNVGGADEVITDDASITPAYKTPIKRTPKAKASAAVHAKPKSAPAKGATKRRASQPNAGSNKRKRNASDVGLVSVNAENDDVEENSTADDDYDEPMQVATPRRRVNKDSLSPTGPGARGGSVPRRSINASALLNRPIVTRPVQQTIDVNSCSQALMEREITPSSLTFGFLGLGTMGSLIVKDLLCTGHKVVVWNRTAEKSLQFVAIGAEVKDTPMDVVEAADIIFCCVSGPKASRELVFGNCGVLQHRDITRKAYVEMTTIDPDTSNDIARAIAEAGGRYLEVQLHGTRQDAEEGMLIILAGGDRTVFEECHSCFKTIAKNTFFLGAEVGNACKVNLILQTILGVSLVGLAEALALADRFQISLKDIIDIFELTSMNSPMLLSKGKEMAKGDFNPQQPLCHMQKDLRLALQMAENLDQSMPVTAITNEVFKHTKRLGYNEHDASAVFVRSRF